MHNATLLFIFNLTAHVRTTYFSRQTPVQVSTYRTLEVSRTLAKRLSLFGAAQTHAQKSNTSFAAVEIIAGAHTRTHTQRERTSSRVSQRRAAAESVFPRQTLHAR